MEEFELEPGEEVILAVRQHMLVFILKVIPFPFLAVLPFVLLYAGSALLAHTADVNSPLVTMLSFGNSTVRFFFGAWWLFIWMAFFTLLMRQFLTQWIITTTRIVDIHQYGFFNRKVSSFLLIRVQDVTTEIYGLLGTMVGFGTLNVETAGRDEKFVMDGLSNPEGVRDVIMREIALLHADGNSSPILSGL